MPFPRLPFNRLINKFVIYLFVCFLFVGILGAEVLRFVGRGNGRLHMTFVNCDGTEDNITECSYFPAQSYDTHFSDVGVRCHPRGKKC